LTNAVISLEGPAPPGGAMIKLHSNFVSVAQVQPTVFIPAGHFSTYEPGPSVFLIPVTLTTNTVILDRSVQITATLDNVNAYGSVEVLRPGLATPTALTVGPNPLQGGMRGTGSVSLTLPAQRGGAYVTLSVDRTDLVSIPAQIVVPAGSLGQTFVVRTKAVTVDTPVTFSAKLNGGVATFVLTLKP
jgi:hypothetical protein